MRYKRVQYIQTVSLFWILTLFIAGFYSTVTAQLVPEMIEYDGNRFTYYSDSEHNRIPDFSHAGYRGGGVPLPAVPVRVTIGPVGGDNSAHIQQAIREVSRMQPDENGIRGAVLLKPGNYFISNNLTISESGVVLRGSGDGKDPARDTIIRVSQAVKGTVLQIGNENTNWFRRAFGTETELEFNFLPVGTRVFNVKNPDLFSVGDDVVIRHFSTEKWLESIDYGGTEGAPKWEEGFIDLYYYRTITGIHDSTIAVDAPIYNHFDSEVSVPIMYKPIRSNLVTEAGVENLRIQILSAGTEAENHAENAILFRGVENGWADRVSVAHFKITGIGTHTSRNITIQNSKAVEPHSRLTGTRRYNFNTDLFSNNILFTNVLASGGRRDFISNGTSVASGVVFHNSRSISTNGSSEGHQKWSQALLYDSIIFEDSNHFNVLSLYNRGNFGSSHGWGAVHSVAWNVDAGDNYIYIQKPPRAQNYGFFNTGRVSGDGLFAHPDGFISGTNTEPYPGSIYNAQLKERLTYGVPPDMPLSVSVSDDRSGELTIRWKHYSVADTEVIIERSADLGKTYSQIARVSANNNQFIDKEVIEKLYYYRLRAADSNGYSAYTFPKSGFPFFTFESLSPFNVNTPVNGEFFHIDGAPDASVRFNWQENNSELEVTYTWKLYDDRAEKSEPIFQLKPVTSNSLEISYAVLDSLFADLGLEIGDRLSGRWTITANTLTLNRDASRQHTIVFERGSVFNSGLLNGKSFELEQNYPNPFNPVTTIRYHLAEQSDVKFIFYNLKGVQVAVMNEGTKPRGTHEIQFTSQNLSSGVYFYRIQLGNQAQTKKMVIIK